MSGPVECSRAQTGGVVLYIDQTQGSEASREAMCEVERDALLVIACELRTLRGPLSTLMYGFAVEIFLP
jgi:hypothetical protein